jgi:RES domain-containing protein
MRSVWRISNHTELNGLGGEKWDGRWHTAAPGKRIVYLSQNPAISLLETIANLRGNPKFFPETYQLLKVNVPDAVSENALAPGLLLEKWRDTPDETRKIGDRWLAKRESALLAVPSVPVPESTNYLLNPLHPDAGNVTIQWNKRIAYDRRLFHVYDV